MIITDNNSPPLLILIFYVKSYHTTSQFEWVYFVFLALDGLIMMCSGFLMIYTVYLALTTHVFHFNITMIYAIFMLHWIELLTARLFLFPYQEGFLPITATSDFYTNSLLQYTFHDTIQIVHNPSVMLPLIVGSGLRLRYLFLVCFALPSVAVERCFATWFLRDYEHTKRAQISCVSIITAEIIATVAAVATSFQWASVFFVATVAAILTVASYITFFIIKTWTKDLEAKSEKNINFYSLSIKFQLTENVRTLKVIHVIVLEVALMITTVAVTIVLANLDLLSSNHTLAVFFIIDKIIHINPIFICLAVFWAEPRWFRRFIRALPGRLHNRTHSSTDFPQDHPAYAMRRLSLADVHFEQLRKLW